MKKLLYPLLLVVLLATLFSCEKELPFASTSLMTDLTESVQFIKMNKTTSVWLAETPFEGLENSETHYSDQFANRNFEEAIEEASLSMQTAADLSGKMQWRNIPSIKDGQNIFLLLGVAPSTPNATADLPKVAPTGCTYPGNKQNTICNKTFKPVCGCNGITYPNVCNAKSDGVLSWTTGPCKTCQNFALIGSIKDVPAIHDPVCGCNGIDYSNKYDALNNGVLLYKKGKCPSPPHSLTKAEKD